MRGTVVLWVLVALVALSLKSSASQPHDTSPLVTTVHGVLRGSVIQSRLGRPIYSFRGVRFAQPPVGNLRFKLPEKQHNPERPVMVFFHPGGFYGLTAHSKAYGPEYLLDQDIVLVTTNYRIGALGFLSTGDRVLPGNYGMKDQVATLQWVKQNIAAFGGNPDSVTIAGYSAGSISVMLHMVSPMSRGLFHRGIAMSGSAFRGAYYELDVLSLAKRQAALLNCPVDSSQQIKNCLMKKEAQEIASSLRGLIEWGNSPVIGPVIEPASGPERFLEAHPAKLFLSGKFVEVPLITGMTKDEFSYSALPVILNSSWAEDMDKNFDTVAPIVFIYERNTERSRMISRELRKFYLKDQPLTNASLSSLGELISDAAVGFPEDKASKIISHVSRAPLYYYRFSYQGRYSTVYRPQTNIPYGVVHHDDQMYLFFISALFPAFKPEDPETKIVERQTKMWANFVQTGNPTPQKSDVLDNVIWRQLTPRNLAYLDMGSHLEMREGLYKERMAVWERLFPLATFPQSPNHNSHRKN
ncbi:Esterase FE4 [Cryptotermes secundus]|uniref:Carboxylic ester hydrolase n=1 Tax=Cryptotermes secundus TaxID=105785 RepID=A0A2J7Q6N7_9NEOP|nr:esterase FE4 isoform X2 [Cryptotermes secundus]PNF24245.1 Esterase FE4 [Cryptotermes secundus]